MVTVSHIVKKIVSDQPFVEEALGRGVISFANLAEELSPKVEEELGKKAKHAAIVMAIRRYADEISIHRKHLKEFDYTGEILMKTNISDFTVVKSQSLLAKLKTIHNLVDFERGDTLNVILGNNEVSIVISEKYAKKLAKFLAGESINVYEIVSTMTELTFILGRKDSMKAYNLLYGLVGK